MYSNEYLINFVKNGGKTPEQVKRAESKKAVKSIVGGGIVGGIIGGPAGAVVGALAGKAKHDSQK